MRRHSQPRMPSLNPALARFKCLHGKCSATRYAERGFAFSPHAHAIFPLFSISY
ncbi:hypothetical protein CV_2482 [Chromobacterium violaceum ATCC 12472]|uniref:Uncharacterized protein n=1 Tax=Chromobacterium violaceum (strain ATCC 12472 / DSM 30191 / JCM 1249 / CCUG 213 / NBRC 12614 / NCIMB 9131 / NCTC 9757 / MK) TaxID=243365 RepID=Q7NV63_CHRVO|nr:hypothetical protein CV_2482 [Chromobacterium violaceum ATCC 12472]